MKNKHLELSGRVNIETGLNNNKSFKTIARELGKDCTTISKEVKAHRTNEKTGAYGRAFNDCLKCHLRLCKEKQVCNLCFSKNRNCWSCGKCTETCKEYTKYVCPKLSKAPYVCNGCENRMKCSLEKMFYHAQIAQDEYEHLKSEARSGIALSEDELTRIDNIISPLLEKGQSLHNICLNHSDEIMICERTAYKYINSNLFSAKNIDMPRTVRMSPRKKIKTAFKVDKKCRINRTFADYKNYIAEHPDIPIVQMDTVEGIKGGAVLLTIHFTKSELQLAFFRDHNDSKSVTDIFDNLYTILKPRMYKRLFKLILTDNGSEFSNPTAIEYDKNGKLITKIFYCDPNASFQKGCCENNHEFIRRIIPKGVDLGNYSQEQISVMMSHINSYARKSLGDKTPYDVFAFTHGEDTLKKFNITKIPPDDVKLKPSLLKKNQKR
jgi:IS30 family transposase